MVSVSIFVFFMVSIFVVQLLKKYCEIIMFSENQPPHLPRQEQSPITESALTSADGQ